MSTQHGRLAVTCSAFMLRVTRFPGCRLCPVHRSPSILTWPQHSRLVIPPCMSHAELGELGMRGAQLAAAAVLRSWHVDLTPERARSLSSLLDHSYSYLLVASIGCIGTNACIPSSMILCRLSGREHIHQSVRASDRGTTENGNSPTAPNKAQIT